MASRSITLEYVNASTGVYTSNPKELHVAKTGNDTTGTGTDALPFLTINKAISLANYGTAIKVHAGTYQENSGVAFGATTFSLAAVNSGSVSRPTILQAFEGDEGLVNLDGQNVRPGFQMGYRDYWVITGLRFINTYWHGIMNWDLNDIPAQVGPPAVPAKGWKTSGVTNPPLSLFSVGCRIENNFISVKTANPGENSACISPWTTKDWIITNNKLDGLDGTDGFFNVTGVNAIQTFGAINLKVYNNEVLNSNIFFYAKNHYTADGARTLYDESEVYLNKVKAGNVAFVSGIQGAGLCESGNHYWHNNIVYGNSAYSTNAYVQCDTGGAYAQSGSLRLENNTFDMGANSSNKPGVFINAFISTKFKGNVTVGSVDDLTFGGTPAGKLTYLTESDYNVWTTSFTAKMNLYATGATTITGLASWQASAAGTPSSLAVSNPDTHSLASQSTTMFTDYAGRDYTPANSVLSGRMPDGSNAGAYQLGTEIIGVLPTYSAGV